MNDIETGHLINSQFGANGTDTFRAIDVATGESIEPDFHEATPAEIDRACEAAQDAFDAFRALPLETRARLLEAIADRFETYADAFAARAPRESGLPEARIRGELGRTTGQLRLFADVVRRGDFLGARIDTAGEGAAAPDVRQCKLPVGPVAVFAVSNFPLAFSVAGGDTASALAAGCPVVIKAHPAHPGTSALAAAAVIEAVKEVDGVPDGVFALIHGRTNAVGERLVRHPAIRAVGFTGSFAGGTALARIAADRPEPIPVYAEMGSINPVFLLPGALTARGREIAESYAASVNLGCGQFCTNPGLVFAAGGDALDTFIEAAAVRIEDAPAGAMLTPATLSGYEAGLARLDKTTGVTRVATGKSASGRAQARLYRTTLATLEAQPEILQEVFGPVSIVVEVPDEAALARGASLMPGQLTVTLHATPEELGRHGELVRILEKCAGRLLFGGFPTGVRVSPAMVHGGPYPATTSYGMTTSVGTLAIDRFLRPVCYQSWPDALLPKALQNANPLGVRRLVNSDWQAGALKA